VLPAPAYRTKERGMFQSAIILWSLRARRPTLDSEAGDTAWALFILTT
jgi:hypothetical protein